MFTLGDTATPNALVYSHVRLESGRRQIGNKWPPQFMVICTRILHAMCPYSFFMQPKFRTQTEDKRKRCCNRQGARGAKRDADCRGS